MEIPAPGIVVWLTLRTLGKIHGHEARPVLLLGLQFELLQLAHQLTEGGSSWPRQRHMTPEEMMADSD